MDKITFANSAFEEYLSWNEDKKIQKKINSLIKEIMRTPFLELENQNL